MNIQMISSVLFVKDIHASRRFYEEVMGQKVVMDFGVNIDFGGFSLWQRDHACSLIFGQDVEDAPARSRNGELAFESDQPEEVCRRLEAAGVEWINRYHEQPWGQRSARFYDPDGHILELGEHMHVVVARLMAQGRTLDEIAQQTAMPLDVVRQMAGQTEQP